ncbi:hypothetical protein ABZT26_35165 [Streptomyces sp. NPDC005395]|uniref:hypothetical protein n=1 Tax=Streptomyces sp. NPDC005395 TaxID=3157042 RepID=UPI0033AE1C1F
MASEATAAPFDRGAAARLAGQVLAGLGAAKRRINPGGDSPEPGEEHPGYGLHQVLAEMMRTLGELIEREGWTRGETYVPQPWSTETRRVEDLRTDDVFWCEPDQKWVEFRDVWGDTEESPADALGEDHPDVPAIEEITSQGVGYTVLAVRVIDQDRSNLHEIVCKVLRMEAHELIQVQVQVQVQGLGRG